MFSEFLIIGKSRNTLNIINIICCPEDEPQMLIYVSILFLRLSYVRSLYTSLRAYYCFLHFCSLAEH
jgi:hypothetical protein